MLTHESPAGTPVRAVREILRSNPSWITKAALEASAASRARVGEVWDAVRPELLAHGHMHVAGGGTTGDGRRVASFGREGFEGNLGFLDMRTLRMTTPNLRAIRAASEHEYAGEPWPNRNTHRQGWKLVDDRRTADKLVEDVLRRDEQ